VICDGRVYIATGQDPESGEGQGDLWCIDPARRGEGGDISTQIVVDRDGKPVPHQARSAVDKDAGQKVIANPNSAAVWHYRGRGAAGAKQKDVPFENVMHRSLGMPALQDGLLVIGDFSGLIHCLDAKTGQVLWTHDSMSAIWGAPLVAEGRVYIGTQDGDVLVFQLAREKKLLAKNPMGHGVHGTPVAAGSVLYVATGTHLFAIAIGK
jgi:outer membrane protein assembly factor BamB